MKFYKLTEIPARNDEQVFKASPMRRFFQLMGCLVVIIVLLALGTGGVALHSHKPPDPIFIYIAAVVALIGLMMFGQFRASLKPTNWLLRCNSSGVIIKYRTFLNWRFPAEDVQAVEFEYSEIAWARSVTERRTSRGSTGRVETQYLTYVDLSLKNTDTALLEAHLQAEQNLPSNGKWLSRDYPVEVLAGGIVQLKWNGVRPSARKTMECLSRYVNIAATESTTANLTSQGTRSPGDADAKIILLAKSGDKIGAVKLARQIHGFSLTEAAAFVEKLQSEV